MGSDTCLSHSHRRPARPRTSNGSAHTSNKLRATAIGTSGDCCIPNTSLNLPHTSPTGRSNRSGRTYNSLSATTIGTSGDCCIPNTSPTTRDRSSNGNAHTSNKLRATAIGHSGDSISCVPNTKLNLSHTSATRNRNSDRSGCTHATSTIRLPYHLVTRTQSNYNGTFPYP